MSYNPDLPRPSTNQAAYEKSRIARLGVVDQRTIDYLRGAVGALEELDGESSDALVRYRLGQHSIINMLQGMCDRQ